MRVLTGPLLALLADLTHTASKDKALPGLHAIELHTTRGELGAEPGRTDLLCGASTDRFTAGHAFTECESGLYRPVLVPVAEAKAIIDVFGRAAKNALHAVIVQHDHQAEGPGTLRIREDPKIAENGLDLRITLGKLEEFPLSVYRVLARRPRGFVDDPQGRGIIAPTPRTDLTAGKLEPFVKVAKSRGSLLRMYRTHQNEAVQLQIGDRYRGVLFPVKAQPDEPVLGDEQEPDCEVHAPDLSGLIDEADGLDEASEPPEGSAA